jgi:uncharacterized protein (DUF58 family)
MNPVVGWTLAVLGTALAYVQFGWQGAVFAVTVMVFWLLLQLTRVLRVMRAASQAPVGRVDSAVMLHSKLHRGMRLLEVLPLTRSLGRKIADDPEAFEWGDSSGACVRVEFVRGRCASWALQRAEVPAGEAPAETESKDPAAAGSHEAR